MLQPHSIRSASLLALVVVMSPGSARAADSKTDFFERKVRPVLVEHCIDCHGADDPAGKLRLDTKPGWERGGKSGPAIVPGDPSSSLLFRAVAHRAGKLKMPPPDVADRLPAEVVRNLATWIRDGAVDPRTGDALPDKFAERAKDHWAFQKVAPPTVPGGTHPIDFLVDKQLRARGYTPTGPASTRTLIRRVCFDMVGLPPTEEQLATPRETFPQLVEALLDSPRYGERWGRHWLDVARYSDAKDGVLMYGDARIRPFAYTYRDYVIRAFNEDKPFDEFIREQLAADQLSLPANSPNLAAMGFLTVGRMFDRNIHDVLDDRIDVVTRGFLGLTVSCARCHDHKFDPVPTADYYSLYGVFASSVEPFDRPRIEPITEAQKAHEDELRKKLDQVTSLRQSHYEKTLKTARQRTPEHLVQVATTKPDISETTYFFLSLLPRQLRPQITYRWRKLVARRAHTSDPIFAPWYDLMREPTLRFERWKEVGVDPRIIDGLAKAKPKTREDVARTYGNIIRTAWESAEKKGDAEGDALAELLLAKSSPVWFPIDQVDHYLSRKEKDAFRGLVNQLDAISVKHKNAAGRAMVLVDSASLYDPVIFQRGDPVQRGNPVPRRFLEVLSDKEREPFRRGGGRLDLANAIASPQNPLTARVWVNRVWMHHFGEPLVENPSDFGLRTAKPIHHEVLDSLADRFMAGGWKTKPIHRLILTSKTYQRASRFPKTPAMLAQMKSDPGNALLWRANRRRLDLEQMRDTLLSLSGSIDSRMYGRPASITDVNNRRRTVYCFVERQNLPEIVRTFDFANADTSTAKRPRTTVPQQALFAMNSEFMLRAARGVARRVGEGSTADRIARLYKLVLGRDPTAEEVELGSAFVKSKPWEQYAQVLLMTNELMFVD